MKKIIIASMACGIIGLYACSKSNSNPSETGSGSQPPVTITCGSTPATFSGDVHPIIQNSCATATSCHGAGSSNGPGPLLTFDQIKAAASSIRSAVVSRVMPLSGSLSAGQIQSIACWVDNNAPND